jgi:hypothetical protein
MKAAKQTMKQTKKQTNKETNTNRQKLKRLTSTALPHETTIWKGAGSSSSS